MKQLKPIIWGVAIIAVGVIVAGNALGLFNIDVFFSGWWTLIIIIPSAIALITEKEKLSSLTFLACGVILLLAAQDVFTYGVAWKVILAVILVMIGVSILVKNLYHNKNDQEVAKKVKKLGGDDKMDAQMAIFSGNDRVYKNEVFSGSNLLAVFGGIDLDLRNAIFDKDTVIKVFCLFGGITIKVPDNVCVKVKSGFIFGGITDDRKDDASEDTKYTIYIDAAGGFGGVTIGEKTKEKK